MNDEFAVKAEGVYKDFKLPHEKNNSVKSAFTRIYKQREKVVNTQHALRDISFEIKKGEFFGIVGRNGSGKSTLLKIIAEIYQPTRGQVTVNGKLVPFIELGVGFNPELTGRENVYLNGALLGFSKPEVDAMYDDIVDFAELPDFMDQKLKNYSSGMQVRLAFSVATRAEADILLVDEVLAVGDADFQRKCFDYFRKLKKQKKTVIFVSHDMGSVREYCDRAILIEDSNLIKQGTANAIADEYIKLFIPQEENDTKKDPERVGNNKLKIKKVKTARKINASEPLVQLEITCEAHEDIPSAKIGFKLKDPVDRPLLGTNTEIAGLDVKELKKGEEITLVFSFENLLNTGIYALDVVAESSEGEVYDWWINAAKINAYKEKLTGYPIEPKITVDKIAK